MKKYLKHMIEELNTSKYKVVAVTKDNYMLENGVVFKTYGVAGVSHALFFTKWNKAINAIEEFKTE